MSDFRHFYEKKRNFAAFRRILFPIIFKRNPEFPNFFDEKVGKLVYITFSYGRIIKLLKLNSISAFIRLCTGFPSVCIVGFEKYILVFQ